MNVYPYENHTFATVVKISPVRSMLRLFFFIALLATGTVLNAQRSLTTSSLVNEDYPTVSSPVLTNVSGEQQCVFIDSDEKICFVDFEQIQFNLKEVNIIDQDGSYVYTKDVTSLPVNTILEIDYSKFQSGKYLIEMKSYSQSIHRQVAL